MDTSPESKTADVVHALHHRIRHTGLNASYDSRRLLGATERLCKSEIIQLGQWYHVISICFDGKDPMLAQVVHLQEQWLKELKASELNLFKVEEFSQRCGRLMHLYLLAHFALFDDHGENNPSWMLEWFNKHLSAVDDSQAFRTLVEQVVHRERKLRIVVLLDDVHKLFGLCQGYCLHSQSFNPASQLLKEWSNEQMGIPSPDSCNCTDLFYQLQVVLLHYIQSSRPNVAFVMYDYPLRKRRRERLLTSPRDFFKHYDFDVSSAKRHHCEN